MLASILIGVASSGAASLIFLLALYRLRPRLAFSPFIANQSRPGEPMFGFKILNRSRFPVTNIRLQLTRVVPKAVPDGVVLRNTLLPLKKDHIFEVGGFARHDKEANYAFRVGTTEDLCTLCDKEGHYLILAVVAQHSLSGFSKVFYKYYHPQSDIKAGCHQFGLGLDVR